MRCARAGCSGTLEDGYCNECGLAPAAQVPHPAAAAVSAASSPTRASASAVSGRTAVSSRSVASSGATVHRLGAGLVSVPPVPYRDPASAVLATAEVAEDKRYCGTCQEPVGRSAPGKPGRATGFCKNCGNHYSFEPKLVAGDLVGGQYQVVGCLAHGGLGWIYLAVDKNVSDRWVVLKGLLDSGDSDAMDAAVAERRFLAEVEHPNIVKIYNFVEHAGAGYIVMEYVGGSSLKQILKERKDRAGASDPLELSEALAYVLEILPAFSYLHEHGLLFCDFKPDNVIQSGDQLKLIDLGGVVRADDTTSAIYGTVGFQAPEIAQAGPSVGSDIYTIGRTLAVLSFDFRGYQTTFKANLPAASEVPVLAQNESYARLLARACHVDTAQRFASCADFSEQLLGVLREVLAKNGSPAAAPSALFSEETRSEEKRGAVATWRSLPQPTVDASDPAFPFLRTITVVDPEQLRALLLTAPVATAAVALGRLAALIRMAAETPPDRAAVMFTSAQAELDQIAEQHPDDWRSEWFQGVLWLAQGRVKEAQDSFDVVYNLLPGELAVKAALALCSELLGESARAAELYDIVSRTDRSFTSACAGLARARLLLGDRSGAYEAYNRVPGTSAAYRSSQISAVKALMDKGSHDPANDLSRAAQLMESLEIQEHDLAELRVQLLSEALAIVRTGRQLPGSVLGRAGNQGAVSESALRKGLEHSYRVLARSASGPERVRLVDQANAVRPRTFT